MKHMFALAFSALIGVACGVNRNENLPQSRDPQFSNRQMQFGYLRNENELIRVPFYVENGLAVIGGHTLLPKELLLTSLGQGEVNLASRPQMALWPKGRVPYQLPSNMEYNAEWQEMVKAWGRAGVRWEPRTPADVEFVQVVIGTKNGAPEYCGLSYLGKISSQYYGRLGVTGPGQPLWLMSSAQNNQLRSSRGNGCDMQRAILHETGHALGFMHEHVRSDRDQFVRFEREVSASDSLFVKIEGSKNFNAYDYNSIMHYSTSQSGQLKMRKLNGEVISQSRTLSTGDLSAARQIYTSTASPSAQSMTPMCLVVGGRQAQLFSGQLSRAECEAKCNTFSATHPQRRCSSGSIVFRPHPENVCVVQGGAGAMLVNLPSTTLSICQDKCESFAGTHPNRSCTWGVQRLK